MILGRKYPFVKLHLLSIVSWYHDAYGPIKGQYGYTYYSRQSQNQAKNSNYRRILMFREIDYSNGQMVYMIEGKSSNQRVWGRNSQVH